MNPRYTDIPQLPEVYTLVQTNSSSWGGGGGGGDPAVNTVVYTNSATWINTSTAVQTNSGNWNQAYNTATAYQSISSSYATRSFVDGKFLPLSGGTITGNLSVLGDVTYIDTNVRVTSAMFIDTNSTETALRVTQRGPGDVIRVEDSANPDSTPFIVKSDGLVGIGTDSPNSALTVVGNVSATGNISATGGISTFATTAAFGANGMQLRIGGATNNNNNLSIGLGTNSSIGCRQNFADFEIGTGADIGPGNSYHSWKDNIYTLGATSIIGWSSSTTMPNNAPAQDTVLARDAANTLAQRNGLSAQAFRIYNTYTAGTPVSSEYGFLQWSGNTFQIGTSATGSGSIRQIEFLRDGQRGAFIDSSFFFNADNGFLTPGQIRLGAAQALYWNGRAVFKSPATDQITLFNSTESGFNRLNFGGTTAAFPALKNSLSGIQVRLADDTDFAPLSASIITAISGGNSNEWNQAYNTATAYQSISSSYATSNYVNTNFFPLSGGTISGPTRINNNLTVFGNLTATGTTTFANTIFSVTSSLSVVHVGSGPALYVGNNGDGDIASFYDLDQGIGILHVGGNNGTFPNVGVKTSTPNVDFTVNGQISANNTIWSAGGNSNQWNNAYINQANYLPLSGGILSDKLGIKNAPLYFDLDTASLGNSYGNLGLGSSGNILINPNSNLILTESIGNVGIGTGSGIPNEKVTVSGNISATGTVFSFNGNSNNWNQAYNVATTYQSASGSFATITFSDSKYLPLSGGTITGNLNVTGQILSGGINISQLLSSTGGGGGGTAIPIKRFDYVTVANVDISYSGTAPFGTPDNNPIWKLIRLTYANNGTISNSASAIDSWTGRLTATYV